MDAHCKGMVTWQRKEQSSVIDFVMANNMCYKWFKSMEIDEDR